MVDRLVMCHTLDFRPSFGNSSLTLDPADLLLSKLQIFELNAKDARDITHLLSGVPIGGKAPGQASGEPFIDTRRFGEVLGGGLGLVAHHDGKPGEAARAARGEPGDDPAAAALRRARRRRHGCSTWPSRCRSR